MSTNAKPYKETLNLPVTRFEMKANLHRKGRAEDPDALAGGGPRRPDPQGARAGRELRYCTDGPPYANGEFHMGHVLNKRACSRTLVVRLLTSNT